MVTILVKLMYPVMSLQSNIHIYTVQIILPQYPDMEPMQALLMEVNKIKRTFGIVGTNPLPKRNKAQSR